jgi:methionyl-tRNA formyltransferase
MEKQIKIIYIGTPEISVRPLEKLARDNDFEICAVITQPDKPAGRKKIITPSPVKTAALKHNILVLQPDKISKIIENIKELHPDILVVMAYSQLLPQALLDLPKYGAINIHTSLLPKYRGASPVQAAIINGDSETGISFMLLDNGLDTGPVLKQFKETIRPDDTAKSLLERLSILASENISIIIKEYIEGNIQPQKQDENRATFVKEYIKNDGLIKWHDSAEKIERFIRGMNPWPIAFTKIENELIKVYSANLDLKIKNEQPVGAIALINKKPAIKTGNGFIILEKVQPAGGKIMDAKDFILGRQGLIGKIAK